MNPIILEITEREQQLLLELFSTKEKSLIEFLELPGLTDEAREEAQDDLTDMAYLKHKVSEAVAVVGQAHEEG